MTISRGRIIYFTTSSPPLVIVLPFAASFLAFFFPVHTFFFVSIFSSRSSTSSVSNQSFRYVLPFHSIFASGSFTCLFRCSWPASLVTSFLACNNLDYHLQSERPLAATHGHLQPAAATSDRNRSANASVPNLAPSRPGPPKKKSARFAT